VGRLPWLVEVIPTRQNAPGVIARPELGDEDRLIDYRSFSPKVARRAGLTLFNQPSAGFGVADLSIFGTSAHS